jgi:hypothetical protein
LGACCSPGACRGLVLAGFRAHGDGDAVVSDALSAAVRDRFSEKELADLTWAVAMP